MRESALGILGALGPGIAEVDVDALNAVLRRKHLTDVLDVVAGDHHVIDRLLAVGFGDVPACVAQHIAGDVHGDEVHARVVIHHRGGRDALAAAQLQIQRLIMRKPFPPVAAVRFRLIRKIWADRQLRLRPFLCAHMHGNLSSKSGMQPALSPTRRRSFRSFRNEQSPSPVFFFQHQPVTADLSIFLCKSSISCFYRFRQALRRF